MDEIFDLETTESDPFSRGANMVHRFRHASARDGRHGLLSRQRLERSFENLFGGAAAPELLFQELLRVGG